MQCLEAGLVLGNVDEAAQVLTQGGDAAEVVAVAAEAPPQAAGGAVVSGLHLHHHVWLEASCAS